MGNNILESINSFDQKWNENDICTQSEEISTKIKDILVQGGARLDFPEEVMREIDQIEDAISVSEWKNRENLVKKFTLTIDPLDAKDMDDGFGIELNADGTITLRVHITDLGHYIPYGSALYKEALERGTSIYVADRVVPMFPERLSNDICSLNPRTDKLTFTVEMKLDSEGNMQKSRIFKSIIRSDFRLSYKEAQDIYDRKLKVDDKLFFGGRINEKLIESITLSYQLKDKLEALKKKNGMLDFRIPERNIIFNDHKVPVGVKEYEIHKSHKIIEHFMILANETFAKKFQYIPFMYRVHDKPDVDNMFTIQQELSSFGKQYNLLKRGGVDTKDISILLESIQDLEKPVQTYLHKMILRSMKKAFYSPKNIGHFGLGLSFYAHDTSPIRRFADLINKIILTEHLNSPLKPERIAFYQDVLSQISEHISSKEKDSENMEREVESYLITQIYKDKIGQEFEGTITGMRDGKCFVTLDNHVEGGVLIKNGSYDQEKKQISFGSKCYSFGDRVSLKLSSIDDTLYKLYFDFI